MKNRNVNRTAVVYIGDRPGVAVMHKGREWKFKNGSGMGTVGGGQHQVLVPDDLAEVLIKRGSFILATEAGRSAIDRFPPPAPAPAAVEDQEVLEDQEVQRRLSAPATHRRVLIFRRWGSLGDIIMFRAATSVFLRQHPGTYEIVLRCQDVHAHMLQHDPLWAQVRGVSNPTDLSTDGVMTFDQVAEADHRGDHRHRVDLFLDSMMNQTISPTMPITAEDWQIPIPHPVTVWVNRHLQNLRVRRVDRQCTGEKLIAVQPRGSAAVKSLPREQMVNLLSELLRVGGPDLKIILIEPSSDIAARFRAIDQDRIFGMPERDPLHAIALLGEVDLAITMDSGALWMTHCVKPSGCPVLAILGPTRPAQRIAYHPLYTDGVSGGARAVCLNELLPPGTAGSTAATVGCPACFEAADACKKTYACMQKQPDWPKAIQMIVYEAMRMLRGDIVLPTLIPSGVEQAGSSLGS